METQRALFRVLLLHLLQVCLVLCDGDDLSRIVFVVSSQSNRHHETVAKQTRSALVDDLRSLGVTEPMVFLAHRDEEVPQHGGWTFFPIIEHLGQHYGKKIDWAIFLEEDVQVHLPTLKTMLKDQGDPVLANLMIGHALEDAGHVVIHHYDQPGLRFPHASTGFALSARLINELAERLEELRKDSSKFPENFSIDPHYELAKVVQHMHDTSGQDTRMIHDERFCTDDPRSTSRDGECATYPRKVNCNATSEDVISLAKSTLFAIKTCEKFHADRLPVIRDTWDAAALNIEYFSEVADATHGTKVLPGVRNTERGHCGKSEAILEWFNRNAEAKGWRWLVIADDDTILSVRRLMEQLKCYDAYADLDVVHLGQRYGFRVASGRYGYDYITGGGGMVFNVAATRKMLERKSSHCSCPKPDHPDDMHFGACMANLGIPIVHCPRFHQGRPEDYPARLLWGQEPISFHKFWETDPRKTYETYFREADKLLADYKYSLKHPHQEL